MKFGDSKFGKSLPKGGLQARTCPLCGKPTPGRVVCPPCSDTLKVRR